MHSISVGSLYVLDISGDGHSGAAGKRISEVRLPQGALVVSVLRDDQNIIPDGEYVLQGGDHIIIIARIEFIERVQALFTAVS